MTRNKHSREFKRQIVKEAIETGNKAAVARRYEITVNMLHRWVKEFEEVNMVKLHWKPYRCSYYYHKNGKVIEKTASEG